MTAAVLLALAGCTTAPADSSGRKLTLADVGPAPTDYTVVASEVLRYRLKDFDTARIEWPVKPRPVVMTANIGINNGGAGWEICPMVNAKNSFGVYTGFKPVYILWRNGQVLDFNAGDMSEFWCRDKNDARIMVGPRMP